MTPPIDSGSDNRIVSGWKEVREEQDQHAEHHHDARAHGFGEAVEDLAHHLGVAGLAERHAGRQVLRRRQRLDQAEHLAQRVGAVEVGLERDAQARS
jgi:hypothetical protein